MQHSNIASRRIILNPFGIDMHNKRFLFGHHSNAAGLRCHEIVNAL
jgi:hypothetical protein